MDLPGGSFIQKYRVRGHAHPPAFVLNGSCHIPEARMKKGFTPPLKVNQLRVAYEGEKGGEGLPRQMSPIPVFGQHGVRTKRTTKLTMCGYFNLDNLG